MNFKLQFIFIVILFFTFIVLFNENILNTLRECKIENRIQSNDVGKILKLRLIEISNIEQEDKLIINNLIIIDYVKKYMEEENHEKKIIAPINHVRLFKSIILPCELVGLKGMCRIDKMRNLMKKSCIR